MASPESSPVIEGRPPMPRRQTEPEDYEMEIDRYEQAAAQAPGSRKAEFACWLAILALVALKVVLSLHG